MKKGDTLPVSIQGAVVGHAVVEHVGETQVTLLIPAQRIVAAKRVDIDLTPQQVEPEKQTIITSVDRPGDNLPEGPQPAEQPPGKPVEQPVEQAPGKPVEPVATPSAEQTATEAVVEAVPAPVSDE